MVDNPGLVLPADGRSTTQRSRDTERAAEQVARVEARWNDVEAWKARAETVITNRRNRREQGADYVPVEAVDERDDTILVVAGQRLVRTDGLTEQERAVLDELGAEEVDRLDGRVVTLPVEKTVELEERLGADRQPEVRVKHHYLAPMGPVMKTLCSPEPSDGLVTEPAASRGTGLQVAVIDTGICASHRGDGWLAGVAETDDNRDALDDFLPVGLDFGAGHGTFAAGIVQQLAPDATICVYRGLASDGFGSEAEVASAMVQAAEDGAHIINLSFGLETDDAEAPIALEVAVDIIRHRWPDVLLVAAAGNFGHSTPCWPAAFKGVTAVAGLDRAMQPAEWSSHGSWVDCSTIGEAVLSTFVPGKEEEIDDGDCELDEYGDDAWAIWTGTSFAAPQVVGAVAQLAQAVGVGPREALVQLLAPAASIPGFGRVVQILPPL